jgi:hypothetical protein
VIAQMFEKRKELRLERSYPEEMGKYKGTRGPMDGTFTGIDELRRLTG